RQFTARLLRKLHGVLYELVGGVAEVIGDVDLLGTPCRTRGLRPSVVEEAREEVVEDAKGTCPATGGPFTHCGLLCVYGATAPDRAPYSCLRLRTTRRAFCG